MSCIKIKSEFECSFEQFQIEASNFFKRLKNDPIPTEEQIEQGLKAISLMYLHVEEPKELKYKDRPVEIIKLVHKYADNFLLSQKLKKHLTKSEN